MITTSNVESWVKAGKDSYEIARALIDSVISSYLPLTLADLPDTATVSSEMEAIVECIDSGDYDDAINMSIESAQIILEEEGLDLNNSNEEDS
jgi:hypothetical protein